MSEVKFRSNLDRKTIIDRMNYRPSVPTKEVFNFGMIDSKYFGPDENSVLARIIEMNSVEPKNNFWEYYEVK